MNPVLLKPIGNCTSQVIVNGKVVGNRSAKEYFSNGPEGTNALWKVVTEAFSTLHSQYNPIVLEGAGSISELNLRRPRHCKYANGFTRQHCHFFGCRY